MGLNINEINLTNPPEEVYCMQLNLLRDIFNNDYESILMPSAIKNTAIMFFQTLTGMGTSSNVQCVNGNLEFTAGAETTLDEIDSITGWAESGSVIENNCGTFSLNTDFNNYIDATGSLDVYLNAAKKDKTYRITKTISSENWASYDQLQVWIKSDHTDDTKAPEVTLHINGSETTPTQVPNGSGYYVFDVSSLSRSAVTSWGFHITMRDGEYHHLYFDLLKGLDPTSYNTSGWWQCPGRTLPGDVREIFAYEKVSSMPESCSYLVKISLDGGTNWHILTEQEYGSWVVVSGWAEYGSFTSLNEFSMRVELSSTDSSVTPQYDDLMVAYKLEG